MKYYEPWIYRLIDKAQESSEVMDAEGDLIMRFGDDPLAIPKPDLMKRITACINACAGMDDPVAEVARLKAENQKLFKAMGAGMSFDESVLPPDFTLKPMES